MKNLIILSFQYYRLLLLYNAAFTLAVIVIITVPNFHVSAEIFCYAKLIALPCAAGFYYYMAKNSYMYFRNGGYGMPRMYFNAFVIDMLTCTLIISLTNAYTKG